MSVYGYTEALEAAGATVLSFEAFGSYQGDWVAKVEYEGKTGYVTGCYGSCSGCDAFEAEMGYAHSEQCEEHRYQSAQENELEQCAACIEAKADYQKRLAEFGKPYLEDFFTREELEKKFEKQSEWDYGSGELLQWVRAN